MSDDAPRALLIATAADWQGTARAPEALAAAGFEPYLLAPANTYARFSRYTRAHYLLDARSPLDVQQTLIATAFARLAPQLLLAGDDGAFELLRGIHGNPITGVPADVHAGLERLIERSLGAPDGYARSVDKLQFAICAAKLGVAAPQSRVAASMEEASSFAREFGYPVVLKRSFSFGGRGVAVCADVDELVLAFARLRAGPPENSALLVQQHLDGATWYVSALAWQGEVLCSHAVEKIAGYVRGPATVVRYLHHDAMIDATAKLARAFGINGYFGTEFLTRDRESPIAVIEVNRRVMPGSHRGPAIDIDYYAAWRDALAGTQPATRRRLDAGEEHIFVQFPMEWMRDPQSHYLLYHSLDAPRDDPRLLAALLDMGWKVNQLRAAS